MGVWEGGKLCRSHSAMGDVMCLTWESAVIERC